jgi:hypothetical protein
MPGQVPNSQYNYINPTQTNNNFSPQTILMPDGKYVSTVFTYVSPTIQNQANAIYQEKAAYETSTNAKQTGKTFRFMSDQDRISALIGQYNQAPNS